MLIDDDVTERRQPDPNIQKIRKAVQENKHEITELKTAFDEHKQEFREHRDEVKPILDLQQDIAAVGRFGRRIKVIVGWCATVCGSFVILWNYSAEIIHYMQGWFRGH